MLKLRDLATRADFDVGPLRVSPSRRRVLGPSGEVHLEPLIMQVFLLLLDADGRVVTRDELFDQCWGGVIVGDDSLNRAVAKVRKIATDVAPDYFEIETIPRTGYRLTGPIVEELQAAGNATHGAGFSRRNLAAAGSAAILAGAGGLWWFLRETSNERYKAVLGQGEARLRNVPAMGDPATLRHFEEAVALRPRDARAWGMLALSASLVAQMPRPDSEALVRRSEEASRRALAINPNEPNALLAMVELQGATLDWLTRDRRLRQIVTIDPRNILAMTELVALLQSAGLNRESWKWNERALAIEPLSSDLLARRGLKLWIAGRIPQSDKVIDQLRDWYPKDPFVAWVRFSTLALSDRAEAARQMLESEPATIGNPAFVALWRACLPALESPTREAIEKAKAACFEASRAAGELAAHSVMILGKLGETDSAFEVADGFLLWRGKVVRRGNTQAHMQNDAGWRIGTQWLFTPPCSGMRADPRFLPLCEEIGLGDYWRARKVRPDYLA